ncbi:MAG: DUF3179 domain-containing protein [Acidobacteriota bacterium]
MTRHLTPLLAGVFLFLGALPAADLSARPEPAASETDAGTPQGAADEASNPTPRQLAELFFDLANPEPDVYKEAFKVIEAHWHPGMSPMALELARLANRDSRNRIYRLLEEKTGKRFDSDTDAWWEWLWRQELEAFPTYPYFKALLWGFIDTRFVDYFSNDRAATIRLDEVRWGGVVQDGIPPLRGPEMITADDADYLRDDHVVFGLEVNGDVRAYPKRILAWHEMFVDTVGGVPVAGVYCTLCGTMILYETTVDGTPHELGTSGFLYRSNKLMYDRETQSLWSTIEGEPVIGPLVGQGIQLPIRGVVTTTWGEWRRRHPKTTVLSLNTGHQRDYAEGAAYREYFATDQLMFTVPEKDRRLKNKAEVLALDFRNGATPLAISARYLTRNPVFHEALGDERFVVLTDDSGANRVYRTGDVRFESWDQDRKAVDGKGGTWKVTEQGLAADDGTVLERLPAHRAFWFGWRSAHPDTRLIK